MSSKLINSQIRGWTQSQMILGIKSLRWSKSSVINIIMKHSSSNNNNYRDISIFHALTKVARMVRVLERRGMLRRGETSYLPARWKETCDKERWNRTYPATSQMHPAEVRRKNYFLGNASKNWHRPAPSQRIPACPSYYKRKRQNFARHKWCYLV